MRLVLSLLVLMAAAMNAQVRNNRFEVLPTPTGSAVGEIWFWEKIGADKVIVTAPDSITATYRLRWPNAQGAAGETLVNDGSGNFSWGGSTGICGSNTYVQFNDSGACGAVSRFTFNKTTDGLTLSTDGTSAARGFMLQQHSSSVNAALMVGQKSRGTQASPTAVASGDTILQFLPTAYDGSAYQAPGTIRFQVDAAVSGGAVPTAIEFFTGSSGLGTSRLVIGSNGVSKFSGNIETSSGSNTIGTASQFWLQGFFNQTTVQSIQITDSTAFTTIYKIGENGSGEMTFTGGIAGATEIFSAKTVVGAGLIQVRGSVVPTVNLTGSSGLSGNRWAGTWTGTLNASSTVTFSDTVDLTGVTLITAPSGSPGASLSGICGPTSAIVSISTSRGIVTSASCGGSFSGLSDPGANGMMARTALNTTVARTITASTPLAVTNGDGVSGAPSFTCPTCVTTDTTQTISGVKIFQLPSANTGGKPLIVKAFAASTDFLQTWQNSSGVDQIYIDSSFNIMSNSATNSVGTLAAFWNHGYFLGGTVQNLTVHSASQLYNIGQNGSNELSFAGGLFGTQEIFSARTSAGAGLIQVRGSVVPTVNLTGSSGLSGNRWNGTWTGTLNVSSTATFTDTINTTGVSAITAPDGNSGGTFSGSCSSTAAIISVTTSKGVVTGVSCGNSFIKTAGGGQTIGGTLTVSSALTANGGIVTASGTDSTLFIGSGNLYTRSIAGSGISCAGVADGWMAGDSSGQNLLMCFGGARYKVALVSY